jgi:hypothetical protein
MTETANTSETSVNFYKTTQRNIQQDSHLHLHNMMSENMRITLRFIHFTGLLKDVLSTASVYSEERRRIMLHDMGRM